MKNYDYWEPEDMVFVHLGKRFGLTSDCRTVCVATEASQDNSQGVAKIPDDVLPTTTNVTDNSHPCFVCGTSVMGKRVDRQYCSARCRQRGCRKKQFELAGKNK
jgi:predicted nucleic acid-binding Zn ribbon protein